MEKDNIIQFPKQQNDKSEQMQKNADGIIQGGELANIYFKTLLRMIHWSMKQRLELLLLLIYIVIIFC